MGWFFSPALETLRTETNKANPKRPKYIDGTIGDEAHQQTKSAHNPDGSGMVCAWDVTPFPDIRTLIRVFCNDPYDRSEYAIYKGVIWDRVNDFEPVKFLGDPHNDHAHLEVYGGSKGRDKRPWGLWVPGKPSDPQTPAEGTFPGARVLTLRKPRMTGDDVLHVQRFIGPRRCGVDDGVYGPQSEDGVRWYQRMRGIKVTGNVDDVTWKHILGRA